MNGFLLVSRGGESIRPRAPREISIFLPYIAVLLLSILRREALYVPGSNEKKRFSWCSELVYKQVISKYLFQILHTTQLLRGHEHNSSTVILHYWISSLTMDPSRSHTGIAIIGMACRVSGANNPSELWDVLASSADTRQEITRFNSAGFYSSGDGSQTGTTNVKHAYFIKDDVDKFDHVFFDLSPPEAAAMDPQHRILLEVGYEAFENAGIPMKMLAGSSTGVFSGAFSSRSVRAGRASFLFIHTHILLH